MHTLSTVEGIMLLASFSLGILVLTAFWSNRKNTLELFLVANRDVSLILGTLSVSAAWIWAPALFVSSQKAYQQGLPGIFWFTLPNALALILFGLLAKKIRQVMNTGYTLPEFVRQRLGQRSHFVYILTIFVVQTYAVIVQLTGSLLLLNLLTGISKVVLLLILSVLFIALAGLRGIRSSLMADLVKAMMIAIVGVIVVPWTIASAGGLPAVWGGLGGESGKFGNIFDPGVAWSFGIPISISLLSGIVIDQQHWQRAFSIRRVSVQKAFILGGIIFTFVPLALALLGFIAANRANGVTVDNAQLSGALAVATFLPRWGVLLFTVMVLAGLASAGSAALCAVSSIGAIDIYKQYLNWDATDGQIIRASRVVMLLVLIFGMSIAMLPNVQIVYLVLLVGAFRAALLIPTILALFWKRLSRTATFYGMVASILTGVPLFIYGSVTSNATISSIGSLLPIIISTLFCVVGTLLKPEIFDYERLATPVPDLVS